MPPKRPIGLDDRGDPVHPAGMWRAFTSLLTLVFLTMAGSADERPQGLLWNRSGLAATLPLQVRTAAGADYLLRLRDVETGQFVLAAYIRGGDFFRVLVPPGWYELLFAFGTNWQGEHALFGPDTQSLVLDQPLRFGATVTRKHGHLIDLSVRTEIAVRSFALCQLLSTRLESLRSPFPPVGNPLWSPYYPVGRLRGHPLRPGGLPPRDPRFRADKLNAGPYRELFVTPGFVAPRYDLQSRVCD